jgi:hypothetical protein
MSVTPHHGTQLSSLLSWLPAKQPAPPPWKGHSNPFWMGGTKLNPEKWSCFVCANVFDQLFFGGFGISWQFIHLYLDNLDRCHCPYRIHSQPASSQPQVHLWHRRVHTGTHQGAILHVAVVPARLGWQGSTSRTNFARLFLAAWLRVEHRRPQEPVPSFWSKIARIRITTVDGENPAPAGNY